MVPVNILNEVMPVYLKEGFSTRQAIFAVATVLVASGADLDKFVISIGSCHYSVVETRETILFRFATEAKDGNFPLVVHFDGKELNRDFGGRRETLSGEELVLTSSYLDRHPGGGGANRDRN